MEFSCAHLKFANPFPCIDSLQASQPITFVPKIGCRGVLSHPVNLNFNKFSYGLSGVPAMN